MHVSTQSSADMLGVSTGPPQSPRKILETICFKDVTWVGLCQHKVIGVCWLLGDLPS